MSLSSDQINQIAQNMMKVLTYHNLNPKQVIIKQVLGNSISPQVILNDSNLLTNITNLLNAHNT